MLRWSNIGKGAFRCSLNLSPKVLELFITFHPVTFVSVDDSTFLLYRVFIFGSHQEVLDGSTSFEVHFHPIFAANLLNAVTQPTVVRNYYVWLLDVFVGTRVSGFVTVFVRGWFPGFHSNPVQSPGGVFASSKCTM